MWEIKRIEMMYLKIQSKRKIIGMCVVMGIIYRPLMRIIVYDYWLGENTFLIPTFQAKFHFSP